jgi:hypothetical protein
MDAVQNATQQAIDSAIWAIIRTLEPGPWRYVIWEDERRSIQDAIGLLQRAGLLSVQEYQDGRVRYKFTPAGEIRQHEVVALGNCDGVISDVQKSWAEESPATPATSANPVAPVPQGNSDTAADGSGLSDGHVTIEDIAKLAGLEEKTIYNHHPPEPVSKHSGRRRAAFSYKAMREWAIREWPERADFFPESFDEAQQKLAILRE